MQRFPQMLFRAGDAIEVDGARFDHCLVNGDEALSAALADGWHETTGAALEALHVPPAPTPAPDDDAPPTRDELEQKARELGVKFDGRTGDKKLSVLIAEKLKG